MFIYGSASVHRNVGNVIATLVLAIVTIAGLNGCGTSSKPEGTWVIDKPATKIVMQEKLDSARRTRKLTGAQADMLSVQLDTMLANMAVMLTLHANGELELQIKMPFDRQTKIRSGTWSGHAGALNIVFSEDMELGSGFGQIGDFAHVYGGQLHLSGGKGVAPITFKRTQ